MSRTCDSPGCTVRVGTGSFMCSEHWRGLPLQLRNTINARYRATRADFGFLSDPAYLEACAKAIELGQPEDTPDNSYRRLLKVQLRRAQGSV